MKGNHGIVVEACSLIKHP